MPLGGTIYGAIFLFLLHVALAPLTHSAEQSNSLQKRKDAIFKLADRLGNLRYPTKSDVEKVIDCPVWDETAGWYSSDVDKSKDIEYFLVPYDGELKVTCTVLAINPRLDINLSDVTRKYGKWQSTYRTRGVKEDKLEPSIVYRYRFKKMSMDFAFRKRNQKQLESVTVAPSTTPDLNIRL
ncbi:hypothetical protein KA183_10560 [bacterium]|nr:hypothetical protein [bacterium]